MPDLCSARLMAPLSFTRDRTNLRPRTGSDISPDSTYPLSPLTKHNGVCVRPKLRAAQQDTITMDIIRRPRVPATPDPGASPYPGT